MQKVILASNNQGKLAEFEQLLAPLSMTVITQKAVGVADCPENGLSFVENALIKARHASKVGNLPAIADDSGLCVPVLGNAPSIYSARFAGKHGDDKANNALLLERLKPYHGKGETVNAFFVCALVFVRCQDDPLPIIAQAKWTGEIIAQSLGQNGFGYDPIFWLPNLQKSAAQLDKATKNQLSHRAIAIKQLIEQLKSELIE